MLSILLLLSSLFHLTISAAHIGSVSLWSDSSCESLDPIALNHTLGPDTCYTPRSKIHSYIINSRPTCANGSLALFIDYGNQGCTDDDPSDTTPGHIPAYLGFDGVCVALMDFSSIAFICEGLGKGSAGSGSGSGSRSGSSDVATVEVQIMTMTSSTLLPTATPVKPSEILTHPTYTTNSSDAYPTATAPSGSAPSAGPSAPVGSIPFTGEAARWRISSFSILFFCAMGGLWVLV